MSIGGYGGNFGGGSDQDVVDSIVAEIQAMPDVQAPDLNLSTISRQGPTPGFADSTIAAIERARARQGLLPVDVISGVPDDVALPDAIQTGFGILADDADAFQPALFGGIGDTGLKTMSILQQVDDQFPGLLGGSQAASPSARALARVGKAGLTGNFAALVPWMEMVSDIVNTGYDPTDAQRAQDVALMETPVVPDIEEIRRQQIGLPEGEEEDAFVPLDITQFLEDETPFFTPPEVTLPDVAFAGPVPSLLNQNPTEALAQFLADRGLLTGFDFEAANRRFARRPPFGLPIANTTSPTSLLS